MIYMKKIILLIISIIMIASCTAEDINLIREARREREERGRKCRYNYKGEVQSCDFIN